MIRCRDVDKVPVELELLSREDVEKILEEKDMLGKDDVFYVVDERYMGDNYKFQKQKIKRIVEENDLEDV